MPNLRTLEETARRDRLDGRFVAAAAGYEQLARRLAKPSQAYLLAALSAALAGDLEETTRLFERFFETAERPSMANLNDLLSLYHQTGRQQRRAGAVERLFPASAADRGRSRQQVMVFALPKSAGTSVVQTLAATLQVRHLASGLDDARTPGYSASVLDPLLMERLSGRTLLHQTHAMPWRENLQRVRDHAYPKLLVHLRDPRDALLSYYYMAEKYELHRLRLLLLCPDYDRLEPGERMAVLARHVYPRFLEWIIGWVAAADALGDRARVTSFETFKREPEAFFRELSLFVGGRERAPAPIRKTHFRRGRAGQTDDPLMPATLRQALFEQLPGELTRRFGWTL